ncbi:MAG: serine/threonine protein kinase [Polyangiaceae bacterium]|nr:serine/threonine protein kinase [Polyangiaceae bacterium]MBK8937388.1 serine/threonine protein kinase [Polyangiaceae bacterium]
MSTATLVAALRPTPRAAGRGALRPGAALSGTPYRVRARLASGGMGELFEVEHDDLGRTCVLKVLHTRHLTRPDLGDRLRDEARILASLPASAAPAVYDVGTLDDGRPYLVMERLVGCDLRTELNRFGVLSVPSAARLGSLLLSALSAVHGRGVVHRDVKLENIFLTVEGDVKLLDFGVARRDCAELARTGRGVALGTPRSMAPEQHSASEADARTDLYAAGLVLYELVTGQGPFDESARSVHALSIAHRHKPPPPPSSRAPQPVPPAFERVILKALEKRPCARFGSAREMAAALERASLSTFANDDDPTDVDVWAGSYA